jgi:hypothetical protein
MGLNCGQGYGKLKVVKVTANQHSEALANVKKSIEHTSLNLIIATCYGFFFYSFHEKDCVSEPMSFVSNVEEVVLVIRLNIHRELMRQTIKCSWQRQGLVA